MPKSERIRKRKIRIVGGGTRYNRTAGPKAGGSMKAQRRAARRKMSKSERRAARKTKYRATPG